MRVLILTKIFPNSAEPRSSPFNRQQFSALSRLCDVEVLATIPWFPGAAAFAKWSRAGRLLDVPMSEIIDGVTVHHPRVVFLPKVHAVAGPLYAASLARAAMKYDGKVDVVLGSWAYPDGFAAVALARLLGVPAVIKLHGSDMNVVAELAGPRRLLKWALSHAARVVAVSRPLRDRAIALGADATTVDVVPNGVDRARFFPSDRDDARRALGIATDGPIAICVGNVERHKGVVDLVQAFTRTADVGPRARLYVIGEGSASTECRRIAEAARAPITFVGARSHAEVPTWMAACDVLVLPSWNEGTPNVVLEALACGRRVVATAVGGVPDVVPSAAAGVLVPPKNPEALAGAIGQALAEPYNPATVVNALGTPDWAESASMLHASLYAAVSPSTRKAA
jgi:glycosyltransferase involved in cell wall biosynthesis